MIDVALLDDAVRHVNVRLRSHGGGIELMDATACGEVHVRFIGMCCGCPWKALTWLATVRDALADVPGVFSVEAQGTRISSEAEQRWRATMSPPTC